MNYRLITVREVADKLSCSVSQIYIMIGDGSFPGPVKTGPRASRWVEAEVDAWIEARMAEREAPKA